MQQERTLSIVKPNAMKKNILGDIISTFEKAGLRIIAAKMVRLTKEQCCQFYEEHKDKPFFSEVVSFMISGPVFLMCLEGPNAIKKNRELMGATDPAQAEPETLRKKYGDSVEANALHGSDSAISAQRELDLLFTQKEVFD